MKSYAYLFLFLTFMMSCSKPNQENQQAGQDAPKLSTVLDNYYEERLPLFPLEATAIADHRFD
jgi:hypothetical protein